MFTATFFVCAFMLPTLSSIQDVSQINGFRASILVEEKAAPNDDAFVVLLAKNGTLYDLEGHEIEDKQLKLILFVGLGSPKGRCNIYLDVARGTSTAVLAKAIERFHRQADPKLKTHVLVRF